MNKNKVYQIAIDGPSGSGKSTIATLLSQQLDFIYINTGLLFRGFSYIFYKLNPQNLSIENLIKHLKKSDDIEYKKGHFYYQKVNITEKLKSSEISKLSSEIAQIEILRNYILELEHKIATNQNIVIEGRDTTTVGFPNAFLKIFLTSSPKIRARRRFLELQQLNLLKNQTEQEIYQQILDRDHQDTNRKIAPLKKADDAIIVDSDNFVSIGTIVAHIERLFLEKKSKIKF